MDDEITNFEQFNKKLNDYHLSDDELLLLNSMIGPFITKVKLAFGNRHTQALVTMLGSALSHELLDREEGFFARIIVNEWLAISAKNHSGEVFMIVGADDEREDIED